MKEKRNSKRITDPWHCYYCGQSTDAQTAQKTWTIWRDRRRNLVGAILACCPDEMCRHAARGEHINFDAETVTP